jgi:hypothetical protein
MTPETQAQMDAHVRAIAGLLHADAKAEGMPMTTLGEIEQTVRQQLQTHVSPEIGNFLSKQTTQKRASHPDA